jgi:hypothetical protein
MEEHLAVGKDAGDFPVHTHIGDVKDRRMTAAFQRIEIIDRRPEVAKPCGKPHLIHFVQALIAKERDAVFLPGAPDAHERRLVHRFAQIEPSDFNTDGR